MKKSLEASSHPGQYVREAIIMPENLTVTKVAEILGVGRPALSNFLNGKAALSADMAARIERAFKISAKKLHDLQAAYDAAHMKGAPANTNTYVPPFLDIVANEIETWASSMGARSRLPVLLRTLVHSTGIGLTQVDFPGNDDSQRPGWDGFVSADEGTPWIPQGQSGWEFGCDNEPKGKADKDYEKSVMAVAYADRKQTTFVFVTPRRWKAKTQWVNTRKAEGQWSDVRVYDASDLEQWLEQSVAGQIWFANETQRFASYTRSLDKCWQDWAYVADPPLTGALFKTAIAEAKDTIISALEKLPQGPVLLSADSTGEAVAFLSQLFSDVDKKLVHYRDRVIVFDQTGALPQLAAGSSNFIAVVTTREVERELSLLPRKMHSIVVYPRNANIDRPPIQLEPLNYDAFHDALESAGYDREEIDRLENESGRSLTVLRRRLSKIPAIRTPDWADDAEIAAQLVPFMFAGAWNSTNGADQAILSCLAQGTRYPDLEKKLQQLLTPEDAPLWSVGTYRGVVSKIDNLFAIKQTITRADLETYFKMAEKVLSEDNPALDLPEEERIFASLRGKTRDISGALRNGISETLVLLAVHGNGLFYNRLGIDVEGEAIRLVRKLLGDPLTTRILEAHDRDLPTYAEVCPDEFLRILEKDLKSSEPASVGLMRPVNAGLFSGCPRIGLLWALESLAWSPKTLTRTVLILARLAEIKIDDNWAHKPIASLKAIFRSWLPQTAANIDRRIGVLEALANRFPHIAWEICMDQFGQTHQTGSYSHKPRWRDEARGYGGVASDQERHAFVIKAINMALAWPAYDRSMLGNLVERLNHLYEPWQETIWKIISQWAATASDFDKAWLREKVRTTILSVRGVKWNRKKQLHQLEHAAKAAYDALEPTDLLNKHEWLFREEWVQESYDEIHAEELNFEKRAGRIKSLRTDALKAIICETGVEGALRLAEMGKAPYQIGAILAEKIFTRFELENFIIAIAKPSDKANTWIYQRLAEGALWALTDDSSRTEVLQTLKNRLPLECFVWLLGRSPCRIMTWNLVAELDIEHQQAYWREVDPRLGIQDDDELNELVEKLLAVKRPWTAFQSINHRLEGLSPTLLFRLMEAMVAGGDESEVPNQLDSYYLGKAFDVLDKSNCFSVEQMAGLEFCYLDVLTQSNREGANSSIPHLEAYFNNHPEFFAQVIAWVYRRKDGQEDSHDLKLSDPAAIHHRAKKGYKLLDELANIPGRNQQGDIDPYLLFGWTMTVRQLCSEWGRLEVGDTSLGKLFACAPKDERGIWPCEPVRYVLEQIQSEDMADGITIGLFNARGAHARGEGGNQERALAEMYREWALALEISFPFVASSILYRMVERYEKDAQTEDREALVRRRLR